MLIDTKAAPKPSLPCLKFLEHRLGICGPIDAEAVRALASRARVARFFRGATIFAQGGPSDRIGIIGSGVVKVVYLSSDGTEHVLSLLSPGDVVGELTAEYRMSFEAATDVTLCLMERDSFEVLLSAHGSLLAGYLATISAQLQKERLWASSMRSKGSLQRVAEWLLSQAPEARDLPETVIHIWLSRRDLASMLDMTSETLCRTLQAIKKSNAIRMLAPDQVAILDRKRLRAIADGVRVDAAGGRKLDLTSNTHRQHRQPGEQPIS
ncbi:Crp/Fnr family transcriptional regulator [Histidinibacterium aquaticum]|uniref:Crp/Fnr family transcriptional regulator n=1 Tax=Histidinibacterium aquaticum TaxID=2613962 RepID=A0A5J5GAF1_9RHOB|nr:Crp/Fnr family transcriptional regulator [Histidinibacterium aquaticum]KAA9005008.1 Crp/Fnr family transcriptional regulator [Histidinibacterium aquaticum]